MELQGWSPRGDGHMARSVGIADKQIDIGGEGGQFSKCRLGRLVGGFSAHGNNGVDL